MEQAQDRLRQELKEKIWSQKETENDDHQRVSTSASLPQSRTNRLQKTAFFSAQADNKRMKLRDVWPAGRAHLNTFTNDGQPVEEERQREEHHC